MIIKNIELNNFRIYKGENLIDLSVSEDKNIVIISGKNGYGKTTFLMSLVWCLYGRQMSDVDDIYKKEIENNGNYRQYIKNSLNRLSGHEGETKFSVSITFENVNIPDVTCKELKVTRTYYTEGNKDEDLEILIDNYESELAEEVGKEIFIRDFIMPKEIAKFFFFDAEKIVSLAEIHTAEERLKLSRAYSEVLGIKQYENLKDDLGSYLTKLKSETANAEEKRTLKELEVKVDNAKDKIKEFEDDIKELEEEAGGLKFEINQLQEKLIKQGSLITLKELNELKERREELDETVSSLNNELKAHYEFIPFAISGRLLTKVFGQVVKEREQIHQKFDSEKIDSLTDEVINDLISVPKPEDLVINYKVQNFYVEALKGLLKKHLSNGQNSSEEIKIIHNFSESEKAELDQFINNIKLSFKENFNRINTEFVRAKNELNDISKKIKLAEEKAEDALVKADRERKADLELQYDTKLREIGALTGDIEDNKNNINQANKEIKRISDKLEVSSDKLKISQEVEKSIQYLKKFIADFKIEKKQSLSKKIKEGLDLLLHKKSFIQDVNVEIVGENIEINLIDSRGKIINKDSLSKGEQQLYATALLKGLVEESNIDFPVFIDSPMQKFDVDHSSSIVKYFYPEVSDQVIIFPLLKKEMSKEEFEILTPKISKTYLINNHSNEKSSFKHVEPVTELFDVFEKEKADAI
ncbi:DNA sulfur modification protein DndD [Gramella sp. GC03-9]|uniref:DNA sulfur modification protein DndD n=1 Tax=Christiangramia oceanisediminis TaxID=2920386 RepID=A0A9X2I1W5_9FLAO|nr:DNA sulfur modification protein DndD [Gramella oceanisediminis]MCP9199130.1 DNA sulfur modification protein DndD [Gramella oceanisediminis]